jgi:hypothetical protein
MKPRRVIEDILVPLTIVAAPPMTITQRNCLEQCGLSKQDYLRLVAAGAFPVKKEGKLRVADYPDVHRYLTSEAKAPAEKARCEKATTLTAPVPPTKTAPSTEEEMRAALNQIDFAAVRRKAGFRTP